MTETNFLMTISVILIGAVVLAVTLLLMMTKTITTPLKQLENAMLEIEKSDYLIVKDINLTNSKEVANLSRSFNTMMKKIKELMDKIIYEQNEQRKSELKALQNQINPHFLYNTLDSIVWLIENEKKQDASEMVIALAKFFRISISRGNNVIPVVDEIEHAKNYLLIQSIRYSNSFTYLFDIDEECRKYQTMKLILQPIIENAIYHGLKEKSETGRIIIRAYMENGMIVFSVSDNGYGMRQEKIRELYENFQNPNLKDGVGLKNVYQRLLIYFSGQAKLYINSDLDVGTVITLKVPPITGGNL
jgi:two-component system sensor histidine kinase YesM